MENRPSLFYFLPVPAVMGQVSELFVIKILSFFFFL